MIHVTRLDDSKVILNVEKIQSLRSTPDTVITLTNNVSMIVQEPVEEISKRIIEYRRSVYNNPLIEQGILKEYSETIN
ncbi:MAG: flagellar FlbD family protein [Thermodesulfobacteriota bacterium]|nr:flagellar FlbD family protein [Thermodesulfobacteriota bacterium]